MPLDKINFPYPDILDISNLNVTGGLAVTGGLNIVGKISFDGNAVTPLGIIYGNDMGNFSSTDAGEAGQLLMSYGSKMENGGPQWVSFQFKEQVECATTSNQIGTYVVGTGIPDEGGTADTFTYTATGETSIDGHPLDLDSRILFKDQTDARQNGIWIVTTQGAGGVAAVLTRDNDADTGAKLAVAIIPVQYGSFNAGTLWQCTNQATAQLGTTNITFNNVVTVVGGAGTAGQLLMSYGGNGINGPEWVSVAAIESVAVASTASITGTYANNTPGTVPSTFTVTSTGTLSIDGYTTALGDRILLKNQNTGLQNGIYVVTRAGATGVQAILTRDNDSDTIAKIAAVPVSVDQGTTNGGTQWLNRNKTTDTLGTTSISYVSATASGVTTFSGGTTGLTPSTATAGAITLAGTLVVANGGTGSTTSTGTAASAVVLQTSPTITTPVIDVINAASATGTTQTLFNNTTTGTINIGGSAFTTGSILLGSAGTGTIQLGGTAVGSSGTINILTGATTSGTKAINIGTNGSTGSTTTITIGTTGGTTPTITLNGAITASSTLAVSGSSIAINGSGPTLTTTNASTASVFTSGATSVQVGSSTIKTTAFPSQPSGTTTGTVTTSAQSAGFLGMPQNSQSVGFTLAASDAGKHIYITATGQTVTIPANTAVAYEIGTTIVFVNASGVTTTIACGDTMTLANSASTGSRTLASNGMATALKITATSWIISGNGLS